MPSPHTSEPRPLDLPIDALRASFTSALADGPVVVSAPTGSGKSTQVPRWCPRPVLVVEPRRVACRSLASRVAELEGVELGREVGYHVRDERRAGSDTEILFVTPGIALRIFDTLDRFQTLVLDEFHERSRDTDLFLALLTRRLRAEVSGTSSARAAEVSGTPNLVVMSATLAGDRIARHLGGVHLEGEGRLHPVEIRYLADQEQLLPDSSGLERRVGLALDQLTETASGDVLVFLPGKGEIASVASAISERGSRQSWEMLELHGGLSLSEQSRIFEPSGGRRRAILSTNVAETSLTVPGIGAVVDGGLVRQTRYLRGRGHLTLTPVALDSADQRTGRAGRTGPGVAVRLWSQTAQLEERTPPEIHRESLAPLVLAAAACGVPAAELADLPFLDPPEPRALAAAREELERLGALTADDGALTDRGRQLFGLPLDPALGALLATAAEAEESGDGDLLDDMIDLVAALSVDRPLLTGDPRNRPGEPPAADLSDRCDAVALIRAVRGASAGRALAEARSTARRLRNAFGRSGSQDADAPIDRHRLALAALSADPRRAHVARRRGRRTAWAGGGSEIELARESRANEPPPERQGPPGAPRPAPPLEALVVLDTRAFGVGGSARVLATAALPVPLKWLLEAGLGTDRLGKVSVKKTGGRPVRVASEVERVLAGKVLDVREETPTGDLARQAVAELFLAGRLFKKAQEVAEERLEAARLALALAASSAVRHGGGPGGPSAEVFQFWAGAVRSGLGLPAEGDDSPVPDLAPWVSNRVASLGVETGDDVALLSPDDLLPPELPAPLAAELDRHFPRRLELPDAVYRLEYDLAKKTVTLDQRSGSRKEPPPPAFLPRFAGLTVKIRQGQSLRTVRGRPEA